MGKNAHAALRGLAIGLLIGFAAPKVAPLISDFDLTSPTRFRWADPRSDVGVPSSRDLPAQLLQRTERLLNSGREETALELISELSVKGDYTGELLRLQSWAQLATERYAVLADALDGEEDLSDELIYLRGVARSRTKRPGALEDLRALWWDAPASIWALASLRELARLPIVEGGVYRDSERERILEILPEASLKSALDAEEKIESLLTELIEAHDDTSGLLTAELFHARGLTFFKDDEFAQATAALRQALEISPPSRLHRTIELDLAETLRRRGIYKFASQRFQRVFANEDDRLANVALAAAAQMAIENQRYPEAQTYFETTLLRNPVGPERRRALWGLGWVAFRTGEFDAALRYFRSLELESAYGPLVPRARYWRARSLEEQGDDSSARELMLSITESFPVDYYSYRASEWLNAPHLQDALYPEDPQSQHPRVTAVESLFAAEMPIRSTRALRRALGAAETFGPHELLRLETIAGSLSSRQIAERLRHARYQRFPRGEAAREAIRGRFPAEFVTLLEDTATRHRVSGRLLIAVAAYASEFNPRATSGTGAIGLFKLSPRAARSLLEDEPRSLRSPKALLDPELSARLGAINLGRIYRAFNKRPEHTLAAYRAGPGAVTRWRALRGELPADIFVEEIPFRETRRYVRGVLASLRAYDFAESDAPTKALPPSYDSLVTAKLDDDAATNSSSRQDDPWQRYEPHVLPRPSH